MVLGLVLANGQLAAAMENAKTAPTTQFICSGLTMELKLTAGNKSKRLRASAERGGSTLKRSQLEIERGSRMEIDKIISDLIEVVKSLLAEAHSRKGCKEENYVVQ